MRLSCSGQGVSCRVHHPDPGGLPAGDMCWRSTTSAGFAGIRYDNLKTGGGEGAQGPTVPSRIASSPCAVTTASMASLLRPAGGAHEKAGWKARSAGSAAAIWSRCPGLLAGGLNRFIAAADLLDDTRVITGRRARSRGLSPRKFGLRRTRSRFDPALVLRARVDLRARVCAPVLLGALPRHVGRRLFVRLSATMVGVTTARNSLPP